jgi:hypothetical protein
MGGWMTTTDSRRQNALSENVTTDDYCTVLLYRGQFKLTRGYSRAMGHNSCVSGRICLKLRMSLK